LCIRGCTTIGTGRRVFVIGYDVMTPLGHTFKDTWNAVINGKTGFRRLTRCKVETCSNIVGEIPDWDPCEAGIFNSKDVYNWNAAYIDMVMQVCREAIRHAHIEIDKDIAPRMACIIGSALNGTDAFRIAMQNYTEKGPYKVSPYLLPNLCANLPASKAGMLLKFTGPIFSPQSACASGNHAIGLSVRMIRDGDCDFALAGGVDACLLPEIIQGFANMGATIKVRPEDRAYNDPAQASRPFSVDRKGFVLSEGAGVLVLAAEEMVRTFGLKPLAEILGVGWTSDASHFVIARKETVIMALKNAIFDAELAPEDIHYINAHGTSTGKGDKIETECLKEVFGKQLPKIPVSSYKSQIGHTLGASAAIEAALVIEAMRKGIILPTLNYIPDPELTGIDVVPNTLRQQKTEIVISNAFGFGGTNCCIILKGV